MAVGAAPAPALRPAPPRHNPAMSTDAPRILLIDDDEHLGPPLASYFARFGCTLDCALRPSEGLAKLRAHSYDAAILDVMLPEMDGFALCRQIRADSDIPIVMLTARGDVMDRVVGLELGADDYLPKPFEPRELVARVQTILRRQRVRPAAAPASAQRHDFDGLAIDLDRREVLRHGERLELTGTEFELLALLASEPGKVFSRDDILNRLRGHEADLFTRAVDIVVSRLRRKLEPLDCIKTLRNAGYTLAVGRVVEEAGSTPARQPVRPEPGEGQNGAQATADRPPGAGS
ncbi:MAG: response regulator transcription factor [Pseudacidovorax sp.]|nr:response regulator transcription factor [Pseudacidovorax sp.]